MPTPGGPDYYRILGVGREASPEEIKQAYHRLAVQFHPDSHPDNTEAEAYLRSLNQAYSVLKDPERRARYDRWGAGGPSPRRSRHRPGATAEPPAAGHPRRVPGDRLRVAPEAAPVAPRAAAPPPDPAPVGGGGQVLQDSGGTVAAGLSPEEGAMRSGTIVRLMGQRGFGFIREENGQEVFFHASGVTGVAFDDLREGQAVTFDVERDTRGRGERAVNVRLAT